MPNWLKTYGDTEGPLGFPMTDEAAIRLEQTIKQIGGEPDYRRVVVEKAATEITAEERTDVSWISTEVVDRDREVVKTSGFNDEQYKSNPIVTLNHNYSIEPVGRSLWRKAIHNQHRRGIKAKTIYPNRPATWNDKEIWAPDRAFQLVQSGLMVGKSIGFLTIKSHAPTTEEIAANPEWKTVRRIIDEWILLEYCCCWLPTNPISIVEAVSKSADLIEPLKWAGAEVPEIKQEPELIIPMLSLEAAEQAVVKAISEINYQDLVKKICKDALDKATGKI